MSKNISEKIDASFEYCAEKIIWLKNKKVDEAGAIKVLVIGVLIAFAIKTIVSLLIPDANPTIGG